MTASEEPMHRSSMKLVFGAAVALAIGCGQGSGAPSGAGNPSVGGAGASAGGANASGAGASAGGAGTSTGGTGTSTGGTGTSAGAGGTSSVGGSAGTGASTGGVSGGPSGGAGMEAGGAATNAGAPSAGASGAAGTSGGSGSGGAASGGGGAGGRASGGAAGSAGSGEHAEDIAFCRSELTRAATHYQGFLSANTNPSQIPRSASNGTVRRVAPSDWTSGFPAGSFWLLYEFTQAAAWRTAAEAWTAALSSQRTRRADHDIGFIINNTYGAGQRLTGSTDYAAAVREAAESLATRFNATVGATRSWDFGTWQYPVIIDNMMNLELLFHATELGGRAALRDMAIAHALTTRANHFRADASSFHVVDYDPANGSVRAKQTAQGVSDSSAWARGQSWGLYGFTMMYRKTRDARFLEQAQRIADFYVQNPAMPADGVPYFDFDAPALANVPDHRDASAGAIAASALLELWRYASGESRARYVAFALKAVRSLSSSSYRAALGQNSHFLLMHSVGHFPENSEVDVAINYADYYYLEALLRCTELDAATGPS